MGWRQLPWRFPLLPGGVPVSASSFAFGCTPGQTSHLVCSLTIPGAARGACSISGSACCTQVVQDCVQQPWLVMMLPVLESLLA